MERVSVCYHRLDFRDRVPPRQPHPNSNIHLYSSKIEVTFHRMTFRKQPITIPVFPLPELHMTRTGYLDESKMTSSAARTVSSLMVACFVL